MTANNNNLSRRETLVGIALCGAAAATPTVSASVARAAQSDRTAWDAAFAQYKGLALQVDRVGRTVNAAYDAGEIACPDRREFFNRYNMGCGWSHDRNFDAAHRCLIGERTKGRLLTSEEAKQATRDALRVVDEFDAWQAQRSGAFAEYDRQQERFDELVDQRAAAFHAAIETPAPDGEALLLKIELLAARLIEADGEDADSLIAIQADARRLLTNGRA